MPTPTFEASGHRPTALVGRRLELNWLRARLKLATGEYPHMVLVEGEAGVGKTRLAQALLAEASGAGVAVFTGRCYEHLNLAYLPLRESLLTTLTEAREGQSERDAELDLLHRIAGIRDEDQTPFDSDERERTRQLLTLTRLVLEFVRGTPTVLLVEDLDWADAATIDLLRHLLFRFEGFEAPLFLVGTCRGDPAARAAKGVAELRRDLRCATLLLHPLSELEAGELARELGADTHDEARQLAAASGGNPLLVQALVNEPRAQGQSGLASRLAAIPHPMAGTIAARVHSLGDEARAVVQAAAFLVPHCSRALLAAVTKLDGAALDRALREAAEQDVLSGDAMSLTFTHPLYSHAAYSMTPELARPSVHSSIAAVLIASRDAGEPVSVRAIAHHLVAAGREADPRFVSDYVRRAADEAMALTAWSEAARYYEGAIAGADAHADPLGVAALHRLAGLCQRYDLNLERALHHFDRAIELRRPFGDAEALAELYIWRIRCGIGNQRLLDVVAETGSLERLVEELEPGSPALASEGLAELAQSYWATGQLGRAEEAARRAMSIAGGVEHHVAYARATVALSVTQWMRYDLRGSLAALEDGLAHARATDDKSVITSSLSRLSLVLTWLGRFEDAEEFALESCALGDELNYPLEQGMPLAALTQLAVARGAYDDAERYAHRALLIQRLTGYHWAAGLFVPALVSACVARGRYAVAHDALDTWTEIAGPLERASLVLFHDYVAVLEGSRSADDVALPSLPSAPVLGADAWAVAVVEIARRAADPVDVRGAHDLLAEAERRGGVATSGLVALIPRVRGVAADLSGDGDEAMEAFTRAIRVSAALGAEPERARALVDLGSVLLHHGDAHAHDLFEEAVVVFERLGMRPDVDRVNQLRSARAPGAPRAAACKGPSRSDVGPASVRSVILFTDVVDSTRLTEELGDARYRERARRLEEVVTSTIAAHGGNIVSGINLGDGFIGLFDSAEQAIDAARRCAQDCCSSELHLHLALHTGAILVDGPRIYGSAVNLAARICTLTGPDEILVSEALHGLAGTFAQIAFVDRGVHSLKGIAEPQRLYGLVEPADPH